MRLTSSRSAYAACLYPTETIAAMCELSSQLDILFKKRWRFSDLHFSLAEYRPPLAVYDVEENGKYVGRITMTLDPARIPKHVPQSASIDEKERHHG